MFLVLLAQFSQIISVNQHFLSSFTPTRISKVHAGWRLKQTRNFKDFLHTFFKSCFFRFWRDTDLENNFLEVRSSLCLHHPVIENCLFQCAVQQPIKLMSWRIIFCANILQKEFNLLQMEKVDSCLHPSLDCERFLALRCSLTSRLVAKSNQFWPWRNSLKLHVFVCWGRRLSSLNFSSTVYCLPNSFCEFWHV